MSKRDVKNDILSRIDQFVAAGTPLPSTNKGKVNIAALCKALNLAPSDVQHFFKKDEIKLVVNALAQGQGLLEIGIQAEIAASDKEVKNSIAKSNKKAKQDAQTASEARAQYAAVLEELTKANHKIELLQLENTSLKEQLELIHQGILVRM